MGWNVKHFHEHLVRDHNFGWGYTFIKTQLHAAGLVDRAKRRGAHRRKRERKPCEGMMLHQDGSRHEWLAGAPMLDLIVTMDDATSTIYSAFLVEEEGTASSFRGLLETFCAHGLPSSLYTDRGSHYFHTHEGRRGKVDKQRLTQVGRALERLGIEHIPGLFARGTGTLGADVRDACRIGCRRSWRWPASPTSKRPTASSPRSICRRTMPASPRPPAIADSAFVAADPRQLAEILCIEEERIVGRDNTVIFGRLRLQLPQSPLRHHFVKARVKVRRYPDGSLAVFHGPRLIATYASDGSLNPGQAQASRAA